MCFNQRSNISTLNGWSLKLVHKFTYHRSSVSSTENDINTWLAKAWIVTDRLSVIWKSDLSNKIKRSFFRAAVASILLYGCTTWTLTKRLERKLDGNWTKILWTVLNKSWRQHPTMQQLYGHQPPISKTIQIIRSRQAGHCWRSKSELINDVLQLTSSHGLARVGQLAWNYQQQLCTDTGCSMEDRDEWLERIREIRASGTPYIYILC